ncbi:MAG TPA: SGNH/GDSL hydrolase family protein [Candidatus Binatia bacterium]|nr:SGNH/GDSL hydrolase family protein [Candidatus Binatia bacterium]
MSDLELSARARDAAARYLGWLLIVLALALNPATLAFYSIDGTLSGAALLLVMAAEASWIALAVVILRRRPRWSAPAALVVTGGVAAMAAVEAFAVATGVLLPHGFEEHRELFYSIEEPDPELGFRLRPNLRGVSLTLEDAGLSTRYETDERGFRNAGRDYAAADVFVLGDSFTFGVWVERARTFYGLLETELERPVITLGVEGYGLAQYRILARRYLPAFRPRLAVLCIFANDLRGTPAPDYLAGWYDAEGWSYFADAAYPKTSVLQNSSRILGQWLRAEPAPRKTSQGLSLFRAGMVSPDYLSSSKAQQVEQALADIIEVARSNDVTLQVFLFPSKESAYRTDYRKLYPPHDGRGRDGVAEEEEGYERLCRLAARHGVACADLTPQFRARVDAGSAPLYFADDGHWNELGHEVAAGAMLPLVQTALEAAGGLRPLAARD